MSILPNEMEQMQAQLNTEGEVAPGQEESPGTQQAPLHEDNLVTSLDEGRLQEIAFIVVREYEADISSREEWDRKRVAGMKLLSGTLDPKSFPWEGSANVHIPMMGVAAIQFQARAYEALLPAKEYIKGFSTDGKADEQAARIQKYMNWQLMEQMDEWEEDMDLSLLMVGFDGSAFKKTYYDHAKERNVSRYLSIENIITPYKCKRLEDSPRITHAYYETLSGINQKVKNGIWAEKEDGFKDGNSLRLSPSQTISEQSDKNTGMSPASDVKDESRLLLEQHRQLDLNNDGINENYVVTVDAESRHVFRIDTRDYVDPVTKKPKVMQYFTQYIFIPSADSHLGIGFRHLLGGLNESANTILNQLLDAGTLQNVSGSSGFYNRRSGLRAGDLKFKLGEFKSVDIATDDIRKAIWSPDFKGPSSVLFTILGLLREFVREISSVSETMMGQIPPSDTTATSMLAVMEQGLKVFSTVHKRLHRSFKKELEKLFILNSLYMDDEVYFVVQDSDSPDMQGFQSGRHDFLNMIDVIPISDPTITSRAEKLIRAKQGYELGMQNPLIQNNPQSLYLLTKNLYEALETHHIDKIVVMPPPPPPPPDLSPEEENAGFLDEKAAHVIPTQEHLAHLDNHRTFGESIWGQQLTPQGKKLLEAHILETLSFAYSAAVHLSNKLRQGVQNGNIAGGNQGMVAAPGNSGDIEKIIPTEQ